MSDHTYSSIGTSEPSFAAAISDGRAERMPPLALLYSDESLLAHVEAALGEMGASVVYRSPIDATEQGALLGAGPGMTLINLDDRCDDRLEQVTAWLDAAQVPVVFNDADISRGLEGWARARWLRHLAAKLRGSEDVYPPRPMHVASVQKPLPPATQPEIAPAFDNDTAAFTPIVPIASRPLTPGEIESLVADFPSEPMSAEDDTETMAAHVDALLAEQNAVAAPAEPAPWDVIAPLEDIPAAAPIATAAVANTASASAIPNAASIPSFANWQLVDDAEPVASAPHEKPAETKPEPPHAKFDFELEPLEVVAPVIPAREREVALEMRLDHVAIKPQVRPA
ncbi:MAG TPA: hypothetical protein VN693_06785 [Rhodanobacteraceae bacterium]|nr:hypothetical protein [Rhodanobacteraceae bacterium]